MNRDILRKSEDTWRSAPLFQRLVGELHLFLMLFLYLWVLFGLFVLNQIVVRREEGHTLALQGFAIFNAFILAKVMLVAENLRVARWLKDKPAILKILFEAAVCTTIFIIFHMVEAIVAGLVKGSLGSVSMLSIGGGGWLGLAIVAVMLFVSLLPFFAFKNVMRSLAQSVCTRSFSPGGLRRTRGADGLRS